MNTTHDTTALDARAAQIRAAMRATDTRRLRQILAERMRIIARGRPITGTHAWMHTRSHVKASALAFLRAALPQYRSQLAQLASRTDGVA